MEILFMIIVLFFLVIGGGLLIAYCAMELDTFATICAIALVIIGLIGFVSWTADSSIDASVEPTDQHTHCPYCEQIID